MAASPESNAALRAQVDAARRRRREAAERLKGLAEDVLAMTPAQGTVIHGVDLGTAVPAAVPAATHPPSPEDSGISDIEVAEERVEARRAQLKESREQRHTGVEKFKQTVQAFTAYQKAVRTNPEELRRKLRGSDTGPTNGAAPAPA